MHTKNFSYIYISCFLLAVLAPINVHAHEVSKQELIDLAKCEQGALEKPKEHEVTSLADMVRMFIY